MPSLVELVRGAYVSAPPWVQGLYRRLPERIRTPLADRVAEHYRKKALETSVSHLEALLSPPVLVEDPSREGVTLIGYPRAEFGLGQALRYLARALETARVPFEIYDFGAGCLARQGEDGFASHASRANTFATQVFCVTPENMELVRAALGHSFSSGRKRIGLWFWELPRFPDTWGNALTLVDELWAPSPYIEECLHAATDKPVCAFPMPVTVGEIQPISKAELGVAESSFLFLTAFDFNSQVARKNPQSAIDAFLRAFGPREDVALLIKSSYGDQHPEMLSSLQALARRDPRIKMLSSVMSRPRLMGLMTCADAFVSLHRAEGFGMLIAEAMALGKPVIVTGYSGNMAFTDNQNACLVDYRLVPVKPGEYPHHKGQRWAEPDVGHAAKLMRRVFEDAGLRHRLAMRARVDIANRHNYKAVGTWLARHLGRSGATSTPATAPLPADLEADL